MLFKTIWILMGSYNIHFIRLGTVALKPKGIGVGDKVCIIIVKE